MWIMLPSFPNSEKFLFTDSDIFKIISAFWITLHTSLIETISDISRMFKSLICSSKSSLCFSRTCKFELMFLVISSVDFR